MEIFLNPVNGIKRPMLELKKEKEKRRILAIGPNLGKYRKDGRCLEWGRWLTPEILPLLLGCSKMLMQQGITSIVSMYVYPHDK